MPALWHRVILSTHGHGHWSLSRDRNHLEGQRPSLRDFEGERPSQRDRGFRERKIEQRIREREKVADPPLSLPSDEGDRLDSREIRRVEREKERNIEREKEFVLVFRTLHWLPSDYDLNRFQSTGST
ncbi:hypothetical protein COLO4_10944 [Corchorus olitorius]|uniref:Uncharacterized protein n=1 Tax=Corchorus olitorius TaxID=93759 RepID=A0A1R3K6D7_9ROSI|nr:hypothetical protein COLO4_10944 [Corchorus olitorius]